MAEANPRAEEEGVEEKALICAEGNEMKLSRKEKKKLAKKKKRKEKRKEIAEKEREEEEARAKDPEEQKKLEMMEKEEQEMRERALKEFEERERLWAQAMELKKKEEEEQKKLLEQKQEEEAEEAKKQLQVEKENECDEDDEWEYVEEGPAEIIWEGNEITIRKKKVRVPKKDANKLNEKEEVDRPTSNPLPPQSEAFSDFQNAQQPLETVAEQVPNFGTEQDKAHCPFHLKTGACRFGQSCSRIHFYPDKSCTLLMKNMYNGPGLAWEQDEGLEYTDEEVESAYEEFYEDVHTEFLKFGEIVNFKVCKNGSFHLKGNVYVHYKSLESALLAYHSINGRYFAGKQVKCEFVNISRWKVAICGEYMRSRLKSCSRGTACNFIHCFRNPGGDYEWADWDKPAPRFWVEKMVALFGYSDESGYWKQPEKEDSRHGNKQRSRRSKSSEMDSIRSGSRRSLKDADVESPYSHMAKDESPYSHRHSSYNRKQTRLLDMKSHEDSTKFEDRCHSDRISDGISSDGGFLDRDRSKGEDRCHRKSREHINHWRQTSDHDRDTESRTRGTDSELYWFDAERDRKELHAHKEKGSRHRSRQELSDDDRDIDSGYYQLKEDRHRRRSKQPKHRDEVSERVKKRKENFYYQDSETETSGCKRDTNSMTKHHRHSSRRSRWGKEINGGDKRCLKSNAGNEPGNSDQCDASKSIDMDDRWKPISLEEDHYNGRYNSKDMEMQYCFNENNENGDCWESRDYAHEKHDRPRSISDSDDQERSRGKSNSHERYSVSRSRGSSQSRS